MNIEKIEKLLATIAKGDKTTLNAVIELLQEVSTYEPKKGSTTQPVTESVKPQKHMTPSQRASMLMDGDYSSLMMTTPQMQRPLPSSLLNENTNNFLSNVSPNTNSIFGLEKPTPQRAPDYSGLSNDTGLQSYAGNLL